MSENKLFWLHLLYHFCAAPLVIHIPSAAPRSLRAKTMDHRNVMSGSIKRHDSEHGKALIVEEQERLHGRMEPHRSRSMFVTNVLIIFEADKDQQRKLNDRSQY